MTLITRVVKLLQYDDQDHSGHAIDHLLRVWRMAKHLADCEGGDPVVIQLAALMHDVGDSKFHQDPDQETAKVVSQYLHDCPPELINQVLSVISTVSYSRNINQNLSIEAQIVQDADRLDAIGAIGIARTISYGAYLKRPIYAEESDDHTIQHFYDKLLKISSLLKTKTARTIAKDRHRFLELFLEQFFIEWKGQDL